MKKTEIRKRIEELLNNPDYEFRFQMAVATIWGGKQIKCGICEEMVDATIQTAYHKTDARQINWNLF